MDPVAIGQALSASVLGATHESIKPGRIRRSF